MSTPIRNEEQAPDLDPLDEADDGLDELELDREEAGRLKSVTDVVRKAMVAGLGAVFMTEDGIRALVKDLKLPKDVMGYVMGHAEKSKADLSRIVSEEARRFFQSDALRNEIVRLLSEMTIEVKAEIRLKPDGSSPSVKVHSTTARRKKG